MCFNLNKKQNLLIFFCPMKKVQINLNLKYQLYLVELLQEAEKCKLQTNTSTYAL